MSDFIEVTYNVRVVFHRLSAVDGERAFEKYIDDFEVVGLHDLHLEKEGFTVLSKADCSCELCTGGY